MRFTSVSIAIASFMLAISFSAPAAEIIGRVTAVKDGDSIIVLDDAFTEHQVRLGGIDAPEHSQPYGRAAKKSLADMIYGQRVRVTWQQQDPYGRTVGKVLLQGEDINLRQIEAGYAWHYRLYQAGQNKTDRESYAQAELDARRAKAGLWQQPEPTPPWRYRRVQRGR